MDLIQKSLETLNVHLETKETVIKDTTGKLRKMRVISSKDKINKSISDNIASDNICFQKTGKQIKEKLEIKKEQLEQTKQINLSNLISIKNKINIEPTCYISNWQLRGVNIPKETLPKEYATELIFTGYKDTNEIINIRQTNTVSEEDRNSMQEYNNILPEYINIIVECVYIKSLINNLEDNKKYTLTTQQLVNLDF